MKKIFFSMIFITMFIGIVGVGLQFMFGYDTITYITRERIDQTQVWIYKYDFWNYIENIKQSLTAPIMNLQLPTRHWVNVNDLGDLGNNLAFIVDILIMGLNFLTFPLKVGSIVLKLVLSIIGINTISMSGNNPLYWLVNLINTISTLQIPYV